MCGLTSGLSGYFIEEPGNYLKVLGEGFTHGAVIEGYCGVVEGEVHLAAQALWFPMNLRDFEVGEKVVERVSAKGNDEFWFDYRQLSV